MSFSCWIIGGYNYAKCWVAAEASPLPLLPSDASAVPQTNSESHILKVALAELPPWWGLTPFIFTAIWSRSMIIYILYIRKMKLRDVDCYVKGFPAG